MSPRSPLRTADAAAAAPGSTVPEADITIELPGREPVQARTYGQRVAGAQGTPLVLHFHGGTFVCGGLENGRNVGRMLARAGAVAVSLAYPLTPFPEPVEVGYAVLEWLYKQRVKLAGKGARIYLAGEEAGGNLAAALTLIARDRAHPPLAGQILLSPMLDPCTGTQSLREATGDATECRWASGWQDYLRSPGDAVHPYAVPGASMRLAELAPTLVLVGAADPMRDEALAFAERLRKAGIPVVSSVLQSAANWPEALYDTDNSCCACEAAVDQQLRDFFGQPPAA
ncbi:MAG: alpha/beta hydrolase [Variovorax sp.]|nr:MAG: alpha/beta hydrolase [Variovorax sp.]